MARRAIMQTSLFPDLPRPVLKPEPELLERVFMHQVKELAEKMGLPSVHIENYCGNKFSPKCSCGGEAVCSVCGKPVLAHCRKRNNTGSIGTPDLIGIAWAIEFKRDRNQRGEPFEPSIRQKTKMERLHNQGVPVMLLYPGNLTNAINFLKNIQKGKIYE